MEIIPANMLDLKRKSSWLFVIPIIAGMAAIFLTGKDGMSMDHKLFGYAHELILTGVGLWLFGFGFREIRKKRLIDNTPTAKVRSAAMGLCELAGLARPKTMLKSPLSLADCVFYKFKVEEERRGSKGRKYWATINEGCSTEYFYVEDETGKMLVDPLTAELVMVQDYRQMNVPVLGNRTRHTEWYLCPGDYVYVLGTVKKFKDAAAEHRENLTGRLRALRADDDRLKAFDTDKDGQISVEEWDAARKQVEQELLEEELKTPIDETDDLVIGKGSAETTFIIADRDEREVSGKFLLKSIFSGGGGAVLALLMFASMLARAGLFHQMPAIPWEAFYR